jgi:hypothetical protein
MLAATARHKCLLDEFERGGLSGAKFAALAGVKYSTFAAWTHWKISANCAITGSRDRVVPKKS